jgi:hypothetical protein
MWQRKRPRATPAPPVPVPGTILEMWQGKRPRATQRHTWSFKTPDWCIMQ